MSLRYEPSSQDCLGQTPLHAACLSDLSKILNSGPYFSTPNPKSYTLYNNLKTRITKPSTLNAGLPRADGPSSRLPLRLLEHYKP